MAPELFRFDNVPFLGTITIKYYGLMYVVAIIVGIVLTRYEVKRKGMTLTLDDILDLVLFTIPAAIVGARLYYVAFQWENYSQDLWAVFRIWEGGLAIHGGLIGGALMFWVICKWKKVSFWQFADAIAPSLVLGQAFGRFGNFMNGDAYGIKTDAPWGIYFPAGTPAGDDAQYGGLPQHPTMLYELAGNLLIFALIWWLRRYHFRDGFVVSLYFVLYSALRFFIEFFRADALCLVGGKACLQEGVGFFESLRVAQIISVVFLLVFLFLILRRKLYGKTPTPQSQPATQS
jgi:phosphatidylglycerol:prolipoprotein diacylglycerol transferase